MKSQKLSIFMITLIICLFFSSINVSHARILSLSEMSSITGKGCCESTVRTNSCQGTGGSCNGCGSCSGSYTASGGTLYGCTGLNEQKTCSNPTSATCTHTVTCKPAAAGIVGMECQGSQCVTKSGSTCLPCTSSTSPNTGTTRSCG